MPDSFFASTKPRKRKRSVGHDNAPSTSKKQSRAVNGKPSFRGPQKGKGSAVSQNGKNKRRAADEELSDETSDNDEGAGIDEMDLRAPDVDPDAYESGEEDEDETPAEKRLRLAKLYLEGVKQTLADGEFDAAEIDRELISARLKQDVLEHSGKVHLFVASSFDFENPPKLRTRGHRFSVTAAVVSPDARYIFTSAKDGNIIKHDLRTGKTLHTFHKQRANDKGKAKEMAEVHGHTDEIWALTISADGKYLASGGKDRKVGVWDVEKNVWVKGFGGHRDSISALAFRKATPNASTSTQLYTGSFDRTIKLFDLTSMGYVETLFGHQAPVLSIDALRAETAVSVGGRDKTVRFWKVTEESQLVLRGGGGSRWSDDLDGMDVDPEDDAERREAKAARKKKPQEKFVEGSIECVVMIDEVAFVSGGDSGSICLWTTQKKKPVFTQALAHGLDESQVDAEDMEVVRKPRWVTAVGALRYSDLFASGSWDGEIRLWKLDAKLRSFALIGTVPALGVVNSLQFITPPKGSLDEASWTSQPTQSSEAETHDPSDAPQGRNKPTSEAVMLVAGVGKEMRFGRWVQKKGEGVVNGAFAFLLRPRTSRS